MRRENGNTVVTVRFHNCMKKITAICAVLILCTILTGTVSAFAGGSGTESDPYIIVNSDDLQSMKDYLNAYFKISDTVNSIDCSELSSWTSIGSDSSRFYGNLNGNGKTIENLSWSSSGDNNGFFGVFGGTLTNCTFNNLNHSSDNNSRYIGIICGTTTKLVISDVKLKNSKLSNGYSVCGGFIGYSKANYDSINNCTCENISISGKYNCANFIGSMGYNLTFNKCMIKNSITMSNETGGGFIGTIGDKSKVYFDNNCICENSIIKTTESSCCGGFVAYGSTTSKIYISENSTEGNGAKIKNSCIIANGVYAGGFISAQIHASATFLKIDGCSTISCTISAGSNSYGSYCGGIIGNSSNNYNINYPTVKNCTILGSGDNVSGVLGGVLY